MKNNYQVELFYGYEDGECGIYHAFETVAPDVKVDEFAMQRKLAEQLDCTTEDIDQGRFDYNSMYINLPEELVAQIKEDAVKEYKEQSSPVRMNTVLYNAISLLIDETFEQYDDPQEWFAMLQNELGVTAAELEEMGIKISVDGGLESVKEFNDDGYSWEFVDNTVGQVLEQEAASCLGCGLKFSGFNVTDAEVAHIVEKMKETPQAFLDRDFIEEFCADALCTLRGLDPDKIRVMQCELSQLYRELEGAEIYDPGAADNIARVFRAKADALEAYVTGKSVDGVLSGATARSAETGRSDVGKEAFVKE